MSTTTASTVTLTPAEEEKADRDCLLTALMNACGVPHAVTKRHPLCLSLKHNGSIHFVGSFIHMTAATVDSLQHVKGGVLVPFKIYLKMIL